MRLFRSRTPAVAPPPPFAVCEPIGATSLSHWHLRRVGPEGLKLGGGIVGSALCGRDLTRGWDRTSEVTVSSVTIESRPRPGDGRVFVCPACATVYLTLVAPHPEAG